jgi:hypothetical protein
MTDSARRLNRLLGDKLERDPSGSLEDVAAETARNSPPGSGSFASPPPGSPPPAGLLRPSPRPAPSGSGLKISQNPADPDQGIPIIRERSPVLGIRIRSLGPVLAVLAGTGCSHSGHLAVSHRHSPGGEARIVVLPISLPEEIKPSENEGRSIAALYATELLKSYEVLDYERFERMLELRELTIENVLFDGSGGKLIEELGIDGALLAEVYSWEPGRPGFWLLGKKGRIGFQARLVDLRSGSVIWSVNRVLPTPGGDPLSVGLGRIFRELAAEMPRSLTPF